MTFQNIYTHNYSSILDKHTIDGNNNNNVSGVKRPLHNFAIHVYNNTIHYSAREVALRKYLSRDHNKSV